MRDWKKNDALMRAALKKMGLGFRRNKKTFEPEIFFKPKIFSDTLANEVWCWGSDSPGVDYGVDVPSTPKDLGRVTIFDPVRLDKHVKAIHNVFYGVKSYEELKIKLDLMA